MRFRILAPTLLVLLLPQQALAEEPENDGYPEADSARLHEIDDYQDPAEGGAHYTWQWLDDKIEPWQDFKNRVNEEWGLDFFIGYSPQVQFGTQEDDEFFGGDEWDLIGEWRVMDNKTFGKGRAQFWFLRVQTWGNNRGAQFQEGVGSAWELNDLDTSRGDDLNAIGVLWWEQLMFEERWRVVVGKLFPALLVNTNRFLWDDRVLFNQGTLAMDPVNTVNETRALGVFTEFRLGGGAYVSGMWVDADAQTRNLDFSSLDNGRYSWTVEAGLETEISGLGEGNYRASWFRRDSAGRGASNKSAMGGAVSIDQDLGENFAAFLYWSRRAGAERPLKQNLSAGLVLRKPFGFAHDFLGLGFSWGQPDGGMGKDDQYGIEAFYRMQVIDRVEFTPLLQYIIKPANSGTDTRLIGGLRLRIYL